MLIITRNQLVVHREIVGLEIGHVLDYGIEKMATVDVKFDLHHP